MIYLDIEAIATKKYIKPVNVSVSWGNCVVVNNI